VVVVGDDGIGLHRLESLIELRLFGCSKIPVINLDAENTDMFSSTDIVDKLRSCSMNGSFVMMVTNDTKLADKAWRKLFKTPLPYTSNEITITRVWSNGMAEYIN